MQSIFLQHETFFLNYQGLVEPGRIYDLVNYSDYVDIVKRMPLIRILIQEQRSRYTPPDNSILGTSGEAGGAQTSYMLVWKDNLTSAFATQERYCQHQGDCSCNSRCRRSDFYCISDDDNCDNLLISDVHMMHTSDPKPRYLVQNVQLLICSVQYNILKLYRSCNCK